MKHAYPDDLSDEIMRLWSTYSGLGGSEECAELPDRDKLQNLVSTCYQVSMMTEELRSQRFRIMVCEPSCFTPGFSPPKGFLRLVFDEPRAFNEYELIKLSPASEFESSLIGVRCDPDEGLQIWGLINSGTRWTQTFCGGSKAILPMPDCLVLDISGPGNIKAYRGSSIIAQLSRGRIVVLHANILRSRWISERTASLQSDIMGLHLASRSDAGGVWGNVDQNIIANLYEQVIKRIISSIKEMKHGGTIAIFPREMIQQISSKNPYIFIKYLFKDEDPVRRLRTLILEIMNELARMSASKGDASTIIGWNEYVSTNREAIFELDEAIFECARFIANLAAVDGAVVMARGFDLVGFGGVIKGAFSKEDIVAQALDDEGEEREYERAEGVGTRHLAAYHLCREIEDVIAIVISQDGNTRVVKWVNGYVTYWDILPIS